MKPLLDLTLLVSLALLTACGADDRKQAYFDHGMELASQGDLAKARLEFKNVLQIDPKHARAWYQLAEIEAAEQNWAQAFGDYGKSLELDPKQIEPRLKRGRLLFDANRADDAIADAEAVLAIEPKNAAALTLRGMVRARKGDITAATADAETSLAVDPQLRDGLVLLAEIRRSQHRPEVARQILQTAVKAHPKDATLRLMLAGLDMEAQKPDAVRAQLEEVVKLEPQKLEHAARLAGFLASRQDQKGAEQALRAAVQANPDNPKAVIMLAEWVAQNKGADAAAALLQDAIREKPDTYPLRFGLADLYRAARQTDNAVAAYKAIIEADDDGPNGLKARTQMAAMFLAMDRDGEAETLANDVLKEESRDSDGLVVRAAIAMKRKEFGAAIADLRSVLQNDPNSSRILRMLASAHEMKGEPSLAQDALEKAIEADPAAPEAYLELAQLRFGSGDAQGASSILEKFLERAPDNALVQSALAKMQLSQQDWGAMKVTAARLIKSQPDHPLGHYLTGLSLQHDGDAKGSIKEFELALEKRPDAIEPLLAMARSHMDLDQPAKAEQAVQRVLDKEPVNASALNLLGDIFAATKRPDKAREQFEQIIALHAESPLAYGRLADLQSQAGQLPSAIETLKTGVQATKRNAFLVFRLGQALQERGDYEASLAAYDEVVKSHPDSEAVINNLAMLLVNHRKDDPASINRAAELVKRFEGSGEWVLLDTLGWVQFRSKSYAQALATLEKAAKQVSPVPPELQYHLGMVYASLGQADKAKAMLEAALSSKGAFPGIDEARATLDGLARGKKAG